MTSAEVVPVKPRGEWGWDACIVCGSEDVASRGLGIGAIVGEDFSLMRLAWCATTPDCREDRKLTTFIPILDRNAKWFDEVYA